MSKWCRSLAVLGWLLASASSLEAAVPPCSAELAAGPEGEAAARCLYDLARSASPDRAAAARRLEDLQASRPEAPWPSLYLGHLRLVDQDPEGAEKLYRQTLALATRRGDVRVEFLARAGIVRLLREAGRLKEAAGELGVAARLADSSRDPDLRARAAVLQAQQKVAEGALEEAYGLLREVRRNVLEEGSYFVQREYLLTLSNVALQTGRFREAGEGFGRLAGLGAAHDDASTRIKGLTGLLSTRSEELVEMPSAKGRSELLGLAREVLEAARGLQRPSLEVNAHWLLGLLAPIQEAMVHLERCREVASTPQEQSFCQGALALRLASSDPAAAPAAEDAIDEALKLARESGDPLSWVAAWHTRMRMSWSFDPERGLRDSRAALDAIEALRDLQRGTSGQPDLFSTWADDYYWFSGKLLEGGRTDEAFEVTERMRARTLTDALGLSRPGPGPAPALHARQAELSLEIAQVQRRLLGGGLSEAERSGARARLDLLEARAEETRLQIRRSDPTFAGSQPRFASLEQVRQGLADDEAFLSFQVAPWKDLAGAFGGGSWLLASTRSGTRTYRLADRTELRPNIGAFNGLFAARNGSEAAISAVLYRNLLGKALKDLPGEIRRLVIVPDDALHRLPFAALRQDPDGEPLATRFQISLVPSATLWLRWRNQAVAPSGKPALVFADPPASGGAAAERAAAAFADRASLGPLPRSREEGESILRHLGGKSRLLVQEEASEARLKHSGAEDFSILHFATHSWTDDADPEHSFVYLAPGSKDQDGLLQPREIADLDLHGRIVVLSTCESAAGEILRGEGVMGLARSFFLSGAHPVVASLWRLRDDDGAALFDRFYAHLAEGRSVAAALQAAQRDLIEDGVPAAAWAGVVVLGDGDRVPFPGGRRRALLPAVAVVALLLLAAAILWRRRVRTPAPPAVPSGRPPG
ncbi:MAG TPA: CHAT domain-containing protein [Thermoanaerobaculia bacterium]|nr:CHAT domain-containing protein [Thermoanaerobaculia bacterium]